MNADEVARRLVERVTGAPGYTREVGTRVLSARPGMVELALDRKPGLLQSQGFFHGGVVAALADHAAGGAITTALSPGKFAVTVNLQANFLAPANGDTLVARAKALHVGGTIGVAQVEVSTVVAGAETLCAIVTATLRAVELPSGIHSGT